MNTPNGSELEAKLCKTGIALHFQGQSVPSFKNSKMLTRGRLITDPRKQKIMEAITQDFLSQLRYLRVTAEEGISTEPSLLSLIACARVFDDSVQWIPEIRITSRTVNKGEEGCVVVISKL